MEYFIDAGIEVEGTVAGEETEISSVVDDEEFKARTVMHVPRPSETTLVEPIIEDSRIIEVEPVEVEEVVEPEEIARVDSAYSRSQYRYMIDSEDELAQEEKKLSELKQILKSMNSTISSFKASGDAEQIKADEAVILAVEKRINLLEKSILEKKSQKHG